MKSEWTETFSVEKNKRKSTNLNSLFKFSSFIFFLSSKNEGEKQALSAKVKQEEFIIGKHIL